MTRTTDHAAVRVCFVAQGQFGGAERYLETLISELGSEWVGTAVVLGDRTLSGTLAGLDVDVTGVRYHGPRDLLAAVIAVRRLLRERRPPVVHANGIVAAAVAGIAALRTPIPVVWLKVDLALDGWRSRLIARLCAEVIGMSDAAIASVKNVTGTRATIVPGGVPELKPDRARGRARLRAWAGANEEHPFVALSGRLCPGKGQLELIETAPKVLERRPDVRFVLIGRADPAFPGFETALRDRVDELGIASAVAVLLIPSTADAIELVSAADVLVAPSIRGDSDWREGFGLVVVEAMQLGVPVVAYNSGSLGEVLGPCGTLVAEGDRTALAKALVEAIEGGGAVSARVECGRRRANELFSITRAADEMRARYAAAASASRAHR